MNNNLRIFSPAPSIGVCRIFVFLILEVNSIWSDRWLTIGEFVLLWLHKLLGMKMHAVTWHYTWILKDSHSSRWEILAEPEGVNLASGTVDGPRRSEDWQFRMDDLKIEQRCTFFRFCLFLRLCQKSKIKSNWSFVWPGRRTWLSSGRSLSRASRIIESDFALFINRWRQRQVIVAVSTIFSFIFEKVFRRRFSCKTS